MGDIDRTRPELPSFSKEQRIISSLIGKTREQIISIIVEAFEDISINVTARQVDQNIDAYIRRLEREIDDYAYQMVMESYRSGEAQHIIALQMEMTVEDAQSFLGSTNPSNMFGNVPYPNYLRDLSDESIKEMAHKRLKGEGLTLEEAKAMVPHNIRSNGAIRSLYSDTYGDILLATQNTSNALKKVVRDTVRDTLQYNVFKDRGYEYQAEDLYKRLTKEGLSKRITEEGFVGIIDRAGRRWDLETYTNMVVKTKTNQAFRQGAVEFGTSSGLDLAVISSHGAKDACRGWEGVVVSLSGRTEGYPALQDVIATNEIFHPNCQHKIHVIRDLDSLHSEDADRHKRKLAELGDVKARKYERKTN